MKILFLGNNWLGWEVVRWLWTQGEEIVGMVLHPDERQSYGKEIIRDAKIEQERLFRATELERSETLEKIKKLTPEIGISVLYSYLIKPTLLNLFPQGCLNLHLAFLPYNRGAYPNVWSIVDKSPAGVTLHYIDGGIDTGDIVAQRKVSIESVDTGESLYRKLEHSALEVFKETWPLIRSGKAGRVPQNKEGGTFHRVRDVAAIDQIDMDKTYTARKLIDILRARTFSPYPGAYFYENGKKVYLRLQFFYEEDLNRGSHD